MNCDDDDNLIGNFVAHRGSQWAVTEAGLECLDGTYVIGKDVLLAEMPDWSVPQQVAGKTWVDLNDFETAWLIAIALHAHPRSSEIHSAINAAHYRRLMSSSSRMKEPA